MKALSHLSEYDLSPSSAQEATLLDRIARQEVESRRYLLSDKITPGLGYDDRITQRLGLSKNTIKKYVSSGLLHARKLEGKIIVSETAVRHFLAPALCVDTLPGLTGRVNLQQLAAVEATHLPAHAVQLASESELCRRAHEIVADEPDKADEARFVVHKELRRRAEKTAVFA